MKTLFYYFIKYVIRGAARIYFRKIKIYGLENIPKRGGILFSPNHQGAFLDPLLIGSTIGKPITSLTRSDVFGGPLQWFMDALKMLPIYRIRNGYANLRKNEAIFQKCRNLLSDEQWIMMFSEAAHHNEYYLQSLSKGSSRLALEAQEQSQIPIYMLPVGINYGHHQKPLCVVHLVFGTPIAVGPYLENFSERPEAINALRNTLSVAMKKCLWLPDKDEQYFEKKALIHPANTRLTFENLKKGIECKALFPAKTNKNQQWNLWWSKIFGLPNFLPLFILKKTLGLFEDIVFYSSIKISAGLVLFTLWWVTVTLVLNVFWGWETSLWGFLFCIMSLFIRQKLYNKTKS